MLGMNCGCNLYLGKYGNCAKEGKPATSRVCMCLAWIDINDTAYIFNEMSFSKLLCIFCSKTALVDWRWSDGPR